MRIHEIIRQKRKAQSLTQEQVAAYLGVSAPAVNKWENGHTYPDITLLPALARVLKTDLNTLLSFQEDLSDAEVAQFVQQVDETVEENGYETAFQMAMDKIHEYPTCEKLMYAVVLYLNGALLLSGVPEPERYEETLVAFYERLSASGHAEIRETATMMLISHHRKRKNYAKAEELIRTLPSSLVDPQEQLAILYTEQGRYGDAAPMWERRVLNGVTEIQTALLSMLEIAVQENRMQDADCYAEIYEQASKLFHVSSWVPYTAKLQLSILRQEKETCLDALQSILAAMREGWQPQTSPLYRHLGGGNPDTLSERLRERIQQERENGSDFSILADMPAYQQLLQELKRA